MALNLEESFNNVKYLCDKCKSPALDKQERAAIDESLDNIRVALGEFLKMKAVKSPLPEVKNNGEKEGAELESEEESEEKQE
jgi:glutaredoxin 2